MATATLSEIVETWGGLVQTGPFGSQLHQYDYVEEGVPVVMPKDIRDGRVDESGIARIPETKAGQLSRHLLKAGTIVFPRRGEISKCAYISEEQAGFLCGTGCIKIELPQEKLRPKFLFYFLGLRQSIEWLERHAVGTTMLNLNTQILGALEVPLLEPHKQDAIVATLATYDDLIETNRRRIQLLERAARLLYKEWFVHLRFPGHETTPITDGVPQGWERKKIADVCETIGGGTPSTKIANYWDGNIPWVVPTDITNNNSLVLLETARKITETGLRKSAAKMLPAGAILMTSRASVGFFAVMDYDVCTNQGFINIVPFDSHSRMYMLFNLISRADEIRSNAKGTTYPEISKGRFREMEIIMPNVELMRQFAAFADDALRQVRHLMQANKNLARARDLLLPKLMSGEVMV